MRSFLDKNDTRYRYNAGDTNANDVGKWKQDQMPITKRSMVIRPDHHHQNDIDFFSSAEQSTAAASAAAAARNSRADADNSMARFPMQLYSMLEAASLFDFEDVVSWVPTGDGFKIHAREAFETNIMPRFFKNQTKLKSFLRQLNLYKFNRVMSKHNGKQIRGCYGHKNFLRGRMELCHLIRRERCKKEEEQERQEQLHHGRTTTGLQDNNGSGGDDAPCSSNTRTFVGTAVRGATTCSAENAAPADVDETTTRTTCPSSSPPAMIKKEGGEEDHKNMPEKKIYGTSTSDIPVSSIERLLRPKHISGDVALEILSIWKNYLEELKHSSVSV
jgi:hypothetical protein